MSFTINTICFILALALVICLVKTDQVGEAIIVAVAYVFLLWGTRDSYNQDDR